MFNSLGRNLAATVAFAVMTAFGTVVMCVGVATAQTPQMVSHQGLLADPGGNPVANAVRSMTFKIYDSESGAGSLWSETQNVASENGVFSVILGSVNPITGFSLDKDLWLGIAVASDPEMSPRSRLTSVPSALSLAMPFQDTLFIQTGFLAAATSASTNEDLTIHANDAMVGLYSDNGGAAGSGIQLGEIAGGQLTNKWSIYRRTTGAASGLRFSYGDDPNYAVNPTLVEIDSTGGVSASGDFVTSGDYRYATSRTHNTQISVYEFDLTEQNESAATQTLPFQFDRKIGYIRMNGIAVDSRAEFAAAVHLPDSAEVKSFTLYYYDNDAGDDMEFDYTLQRKSLLSTGAVGLGTTTVTSSGASTTVHPSTIDTSANASRFIDNDSYVYWVEVGITRLANGLGPNLRFYGMSIEYDVRSAGP